MQTNGNETDAALRSGYVDTGPGGTPPFQGLASVARDIVTTAHQLPDPELMRIAGCLRSLADEVMAVVDRRCGSRSAPRLVIDNTPRRPDGA